MASVADGVVKKVLGCKNAVNEKLSEFEPLALVTGSVAIWVLFSAVRFIVSAAYAECQYKGFRVFLITLVFNFLRRVPGISFLMREEQEKVLQKLQAGLKRDRDSWLSELPTVGAAPEAVLERLKSRQRRDSTWQGRVSGTVYIEGNNGEGHFSLLNEAYSVFSHTNPLHLDLFPSIAQFEAEVVAMTAATLGSKSKLSGGEICGNMTSGGTESILMAMKTTRDYMRSIKGICKPEMVIPNSAHPAYDKGAEYFGIKLWRVPVVKGTLQADVRQITRLINKNTILIVGSAPGFPHGVIDPIQELGALALSRGICFHVDLCLGGFVVPFARKLGYPVPPCDFTVPGVTSISVDIHKYGLGPKGSSVVLYRNHRLRRHQFVAVTEWSGGLYISPSMAGSRVGGLISAAWAALVANGEEGYFQAVKKVMVAAEELRKGIEAIPGLYIMGKPSTTVIAFAAKGFDVYKVKAQAILPP